jgi:hypothetical protein
LVLHHQHIVQQCFSLRKDAFCHVGLFRVMGVINRSLSKWLLGCAISPYILGLFVLLSASSLFNSFQTAFCCASRYCWLSRVQLLSPFVDQFLDTPFVQPRKNASHR